MNYPETMTFEKLCWIIQVFLNSSPTTAPPTPPAPPPSIADVEDDPLSLSSSLSPPGAIIIWLLSISSPALTWLTS